MAIATRTIDPIRYEIFAHRLWAIAEEGRVALQRVSASPIVAQGGECMQSFYDPEGRMILACSGHLRFAGATSDAIRQLVAWFGERPGFFDGDQVFFNDPYVAGAHTLDEMVVKPIYHGGQLIAWTASSAHTADTGGVLGGEAREIYHEGIRILGLKVVERGEFRDDVCKTLSEQCRDPYYVELDLRAKIAANNVASARFLHFVEQFGLDFVMAAAQKMIADSEAMARAKLRHIPDGIWRSRVYGTLTQSAESYVVVCEATKRGDTLALDCTGTSPQSKDDMNSTLASTMAHVGVALTNTIFWDVPWSDGRMAPISVHVPEGSILNCRFPAACRRAPSVGGALVSALMDCINRMLYAAGDLGDVKAGHAHLYEGGPGLTYSGHNADGIPVAQGLFDIHGGGYGATPFRDGVDSAGHPNIPSGGINDIERTELHYPLLYFSRNHTPDGPGFGEYRGGAGTQRICMGYGSDDLAVDFRPYNGVPGGGPGLFGGYPMGGGGYRALLQVDAEQAGKRLAAGEYPASAAEVIELGWGAAHIPEPGKVRAHIAPYWVVCDFTQSGGGYGDPLDRDPQKVAIDVQANVYNRETAKRFFGVALDARLAVIEPETSTLREAARQERRASANRAAEPTASLPADARNWPATMKPHAGVETAGTGTQRVWRCVRCQELLGWAHETYKLGALARTRDVQGIVNFDLPGSSAFKAQFVEYFCPGCLTLLQVDVYHPGLSGDPMIADVQIGLPDGYEAKSAGPSSHQT